MATQTKNVPELSELLAAAVSIRTAARIAFAAGCGFISLAVIFVACFVLGVRPTISGAPIPEFVWMVAACSLAPVGAGLMLAAALMKVAGMTAIAVRTVIRNQHEMN